ncbi:glycoside hydrolase family 88 protein [Psychrosphaera sp. B3R10]|uniref:glycoside hydrolase family 88/105 protein n=1 Tax=unclassified Psychrosphaera TaxID=2641570 RepID=UPI001C088EDC|nr:MULTISPECIES: glycoside hydrolase family 88 protein [unclassified Psychrosphaera]MBU2883526.1 glycoside hydrolase family 88 protein [Psychrosphaera sp. I2R16]MBU2989705.1 glycoside hydrolase family 88 protein [Psychrosphaera sp. B3R10]
MNNKVYIALTIVVAYLGLTACQSISNVFSDKSSDKLYSGAVSTVTIQQQALEIGQRVADWQVTQIEADNYDYLAARYHDASSKPQHWIQAAFYIGLTEWVEVTDNNVLLSHIETMAKEQNYALRLSRGKHADDHAIGQTYLWLTERTNNKFAFEPTKQLFDQILANPSTVTLEMDSSKKRPKAYEGACQDRWCWADALFMAPRTWIKLGNITGEDRYINFADKEFWATVNYLFSEKHGLYFRDSRYFDQKSDNGKPVFWSRGNGWVFAALPLIIDDLPKDHPSRVRYIELFKKNAAGLQKIQNPNGYWSASLLDPNKVKTPEVSGTGFITYGLAWGVNNGILTDDSYKQSVIKGWNALVNSVQNNGRVNWVQQVGKSPDPLKKTDTQLYGAGAVLLAASEMTKWTK